MKTHSVTQGGFRVRLREIIPIINEIEQYMDNEIQATGAYGYLKGWALLYGFPYPSILPPSSVKVPLNKACLGLMKGEPQVRVVSIGGWLGFRVNFSWKPGTNLPDRLAV